MADPRDRCTLMRAAIVCTLRRFVVYGILASTAGCVQGPTIHRVDASLPAGSTATLIGSRSSDGYFTFDYYAVNQVNYNDVRGRFEGPLTAPDEFEVRLAPTQNNIWVEARVRRGQGVAAQRLAAMITFTATARTRYQVQGTPGALSGSIRVVNLSTGETVASVTDVAYSLPPPGYPTQFIPIFIKR
jgi:hypothetical protein